MPETPITDIWKLPLRRGHSDDPRDGACAMDAVSWLVYGRLDDRPRCVSPVFGAYVRALNDRLDDDDRQKLRPYLLRLVNTVDPEAEHDRAVFLTNFVVRTIYPLVIDRTSLFFRYRRLRRLCASFDFESAAPVGKVPGPQIVAQAVSEISLQRNRFHGRRLSGHYSAGLVGRLFADCLSNHRLKKSVFTDPAINAALFVGLDGVLGIGKQYEELPEPAVSRSMERFAELSS